MLRQYELVFGAIELPAYPGRHFMARLPALRKQSTRLRARCGLRLMLLTAMEKTRLLRAGTFGSTSPQRMSVPVALFRAEGPRAAVVGSDGKVHLKPVTIGGITAPKSSPQRT
jgi:hypothetical protein